jgi:hypothetical protein
MARRIPAQACRVQVYLSDPKLVTGLNKEARASRISVSQAAGHAIARGLQTNPHVDPDDRLQSLEQSLRGHMRTTSRDMQILQELVVEVARALFVRLPDATADQDPTVQAAVERRIERMLDDTAARIVGGQPEQAPDRRGPEDRSFASAN